ncbi:hypothetical protein GQ53DRAFT_748507 [Thozetella sp. PMI_491]|nr:hypothetical protein GQ53DRAFT_748507 [Thozetella sp. PMI_491]
MGGLMNMYLSLQHSRNEQMKERAQKLANSSRGKRMMNSGRMKSYIKKREAALQEGASLRKAEEEDTSKGERVWFSRCILNGRLRHWVLLTHGMKYELRRSDHLGKDGAGANSQTSENEYVCNIQPYTIDQEKRDISLTELLVPEVDGYYVCLIGWTRMTEPQVSAVAQAALSSFGTYKLVRNNCQDFLRLVAEKILTGPKAADFEWFMSNTKTKYQKDQWLKPPPEEMLMRMLNRAMAQSQMMQIQMQNQMQQQMQNQMQIQMQNQIQLQLQTQLQNQLQMQMQMQMQTQMMSSMGGASG